MDHFVCTTCSAQLAGTKYVLHEDRPHCTTCFEQLHSNVCDECQKPIGINCKVSLISFIYNLFDDTYLGYLILLIFSTGLVLQRTSLA